MTNAHGHTVGVHDALTRAPVHVARARQILAGYLTDRYSRPAILAAIFGVASMVDAACAPLAVYIASML